MREGGEGGGALVRILQIGVLLCHIAPSKSLRVNWESRKQHFGNGAESV